MEISSRDLTVFSILIIKRPDYQFIDTLPLCICKAECLASSSQTFSHYAFLDNPTIGLNAVNLCSLIMHILTTYAQISQPNVDDNMIDFHSGINLGLPLAIYTRKQRKCQVFAADVGVPISDKTMIATGTKHALACGNMTLAWCKWKRFPLPNHTWPNWKTH